MDGCSLTLTGVEVNPNFSLRSNWSISTARSRRSSEWRAGFRVTGFATESVIHGKHFSTGRSKICSRSPPLQSFVLCLYLMFWFWLSMVEQYHVMSVFGLSERKFYIYFRFSNSSLYVTLGLGCIFWI